eukprot:1161643-Pelagomonas_calceolata.AAC.16
MNEQAAEAATSTNKMLHKRSARECSEKEREGQKQAARVATCACEARCKQGAHKRRPIEMSRFHCSPQKRAGGRGDEVHLQDVGVKEGAHAHWLR